MKKKYSIYFMFLTTEDKILKYVLKNFSSSFIVLKKSIIFQGILIHKLYDYHFILPHVNKVKSYIPHF